MPASYARPVQTTHYAKDEARSAFSETGFDRMYWNAVRGSRALCRVTSRVDVPPSIELPTDRPLMVAANHSSLFDLIAALVFLGHYGLSARMGVNSPFASNGTDRGGLGDPILNHLATDIGQAKIAALETVR